MIHRLLLDPQGGDGSGTTAPPADLAVALKTLLAEKHGNDAMAMARDLLAKNRELEADNRKYRQKVAAMKSSVPEEGAVVLQGDDAKDWPKYRDLGKPGDLKKSLDEGGVAVQKLQKADRVGLYRKAAQLGGYNPDAFADLAEAKGIEVEFRQENRDGKAVEVPFVKGEGDTRTPLGEFVESSFSHFLPALKQGQPPPRDRSRDATPPRRSPFEAPSRDDHEGSARGLVGPAAYAT